MKRGKSELNESDKGRKMRKRERAREVGTRLLFKTPGGGGPGGAQAPRLFGTPPGGGGPGSGQAPSPPPPRGGPKIKIKPGGNQV